MIAQKHYEKPMNIGYERPEVVEHYSKERFSGRSYSHTHCREVKIVKEYLDHIGVVNSIIDVPCGAGRFQSLLGTHAKELVEMDYSSQMLCKAEENMHENFKNMVSYTDFIHGSIFDIPFSNNHFDIVFAMRIYHHFDQEEERIAILKELARVSNGWIIISFFNSRSYLQFRRNMKKKILGKQPSRHAISLKQFKSDLQSSGLELHTFRSVLRFYSEQTIALVKKS